MASLPPGEPAKTFDVNGWAMALDKTIDFVLIFVGLYAALSVERCQGEERDREEYAAMLHDFDRELQNNLAQEADIARDLGGIEATTPGENLGPMAATFTSFFRDLEHDETLIDCLRAEFSRIKHEVSAEERARCHAGYAAFHAEHRKKDKHAQSTGFVFKPAVLTPFYRYEVWELYLAGGVKLFKNKELALKIGEIYTNSHLIERQVADIEKTYNDVFMKQIGRSAATDAELAELVEDVEEDGELSPSDLTALLHIDEAVKEERYEVMGLRNVLELKVERLKLTVLTMRREILEVREALQAESAAVAR